MKKHFFILAILCVFFAVQSNAQYYYYRRPRVRMRVGPRRPPPPPRQTQRRDLPPFTPTVNFNIGYGLPNLDKNQLFSFFNAYQGNTSQTGPVNASLDYQFNRNISIGLMGTYGKVSSPYYYYNSNSESPDFTGTLENWSVMANIMTYIPTYNSHVEPYIRLALGVNSWKQNYLDGSGNKVFEPGTPTDFAYQASFGSKFMFSKNTGIFIEAGYGKYILNGGLAFKF